MFLRETLETLLSLIDAESRRRGLAYFEDGRILESWDDEVGDRCFVLRGSRNRKYAVEIVDISDAHLGAMCDCPVRGYCKHIAAAVYAELDAVSTAAAPPTALTLQNDVDRVLDVIEEELSPPILEQAAWLPGQERIFITLSDTMLNDLRTSEYSICIEKSKLKKNGGMGKARSLHWHHLEHNESLWLRQLTPPQRQFIERLKNAAALAHREHYHWSYDPPNDVPLTQENVKQIFTPAFPLFDVYWDMGDGERQKLNWGQAQKAVLDWRADFQCNVQRLTLQKYRALSPQHYFDERQSQVGEFTETISAALYKALTLGIAVPLSEELSPAQKLRLDKLGFPPAQKVTIEERQGVVPQALIRITPGAAAKPTGELVFEYDGFCTPPDGDKRFMVESGDGWVEFKRDFPLEKSIIKTLDKKESGAFSIDECGQLDLRVAVHDSEAQWHGRFERLFRTAETVGAHIECDDSLQLGTPLINLDPMALEEETEGFFSIRMDVDIGGKKVPLLPILLTAIRDPRRPLSPEVWDAGAAETLAIPLPDGGWISLRREQLSRIMPIVFEMSAFEDNGKLPAPLLAQLELDDLLDPKGRLALRALKKRFRAALNGKKRKKPKGLRATLRDYQTTGTTWIEFLRHAGAGGILADDMGLGKTIQTLAYLLGEKDAGRLNSPALLVAPTSVAPNWLSEAQRFCPSLKIRLHQGSKRHLHPLPIDEADVVITSYPLIRRDHDIFLDHSFSWLILDEAQAIKNPQTKAHAALRAIKADHRLCLTGTPIENHLGELWSLFHFCYPGYLGSSKFFQKTYRQAIEKEKDPIALEHLKIRIKPFILRRRKSEVTLELPRKTEMVHFVDLGTKQRQVYETVRLMMDKKVREALSQKGAKRSMIEFLDALMKLRQVCCDPKIVRLESVRRINESAKREALMTLLKELVLEERRVLIFSQFTSMLSLLEEELKGQHISYLKLTGQTRKRQEKVDAFQRGEASVFLISLKAGGTGLNLTAADTVIHYDPWWNPAAENQATDRAYRIGQDKAVFVYRLVTRNTVEEKILEMQKQKAELASSILDGGGTGGMQLNEDDIRTLLAA